MKLYTLLNTALNKIEDSLSANPTSDQISDSLFISSVHLQRLFKNAFGTTIANYIRSRRLAMSLDKLYNSDSSILDIAVEYGFGYAQSYIRAFKQEFNLTPGAARSTRQIVKIKPPLQLFLSNKLADGLLFGPEIVYVPGFFCVGRRHIIDGDSIKTPAWLARDFWLNDKWHIPNLTNPSVYLGLTRFPGEPAGYTFYIPSVYTANLSDVPEGFEGNTVPSCLCARFRYIGEHHYMDIDAEIAQGMYRAVIKFQNDDEKYGLFRYGIYFEKIDTSAYDGKYCIMEWFSPVYEK